MERFSSPSGSLRNPEKLPRLHLSGPFELDTSASHPTRSQESPTDVVRSLSSASHTLAPDLTRPPESDASASHSTRSQESPIDVVRSPDERPPYHQDGLVFDPVRASLSELHSIEPSFPHPMHEIPYRPDVPLDSSEVRIEMPPLQDAGQSSLSNEALRTYTERVIKDLKIPPEHHDEAQVQIENLFRILEKSKDATSAREYDEGCKSVSKYARDITIYKWIRSKGDLSEVSGTIFSGGTKTRLETNNIRMRGELSIAAKKTETPELASYRAQVKDYLSKTSSHATHAVDWRLNQPGYRFVLASVLGSAGTLTAYAFGGKFEPMAIPINIGATYLDTAIFKKFDYPWNLLITTCLWQGSSFATKYSQLGVDKLTELVKHLKS